MNFEQPRIIIDRSERLSQTHSATIGRPVTAVEVHTSIDEHLPPSATKGILLNRMLSVRLVLMAIPQEVFAICWQGETFATAAWQYLARLASMARPKIPIFTHYQYLGSAVYT
jgi:hypothetical protein